MNQVKPQTRFFYIDFLRALAIFAVIILHNSADIVDDYGKIPTSDWLAASFYNGLTRFCVPMFVLLSGSLLLNKNKDVSVKELFSKRLPKLFIPLVFWSVVYVAYQNYNDHSFNTFSVTKALIAFYRGPVVFHFWFLYMMIGIYLIYPVLNGFIRQATESQVLYFLAVCFVANCVLGMIEIAFQTASGFDLNSFVGYTGYFMLGYYLKNFEFSKRILYILYLLGLLAFMLSVGGILLLDFDKVTHVKDVVESDFSPEIPFALTGLFLLMKNYAFNEKVGWWKTVVIAISKESYGIYIVHVLIMQLVLNRLVAWLHFDSLIVFLSIPLKTIIIITLSYGLIRTIRLVPGLRATIG